MFNINSGRIAMEERKSILKSGRVSPVCGKKKERTDVVSIIKFIVLLPKSALNMYKVGKDHPLHVGVSCLHVCVWTACMLAACRGQKGHLIAWNWS